MEDGAAMRRQAPFAEKGTAARTEVFDIDMVIFDDNPSVPARYREVIQMEAAIVGAADRKAILTQLIEVE